MTDDMKKAIELREQAIQAYSNGDEEGYKKLMQEADELTIKVSGALPPIIIEDGDDNWYNTGDPDVHLNTPLTHDWNLGVVYKDGQQITMDQPDGLRYLVATVHSNGDDFKANARLIQAAPRMWDLLNRLVGFAAQYVNESAIRAGGDHLLAAAQKLLDDTKLPDPVVTSTPIDTEKWYSAECASDFDPTRFDFIWDRNYTRFQLRPLKWHDDESYKKYQTDGL